MGDIGAGAVVQKEEHLPCTEPAGLDPWYQTWHVVFQASPEVIPENRIRSNPLLSIAGYSKTKQNKKQGDIYVNEKVERMFSLQSFVF